jgi:hypothetical protein
MKRPPIVPVPGYNTSHLPRVCRLCKASAELCWPLPGPDHRACRRCVADARAFLVTSSGQFPKFGTDETAPGPVSLQREGDVAALGWVP